MTKLSAYAAENGVTDLMMSHLDMAGCHHTALVKAATWAQAARAEHLAPEAVSMGSLGTPDLGAAIRLPWKPSTAWIPVDGTAGGGPTIESPRSILRRLIEQATARGIRIRTGVEVEFFLLSAAGSELSDRQDTALKSCYDQHALMRRYDFISEICDHMLKLGWKPYQNDHEDANGQFEMNWAYDDALVTADRHVFFKFMVRSIAERHGFRVTFMPKPFLDRTGNGCHCHVSGWNVPGTENTFADGAMPFGLSAQGRHFLGGIMRHAPALAAVTNPTVNSYKRINARLTTSGATWAPISVTWTGNNRTHMVRVPGPGRFELRLPDGAANPYLLQAALIAAGLDGIATEADPGPHRDIDMYRDGHTVIDAPRLPSNLLDALRAFEADAVLWDSLGPGFAAAYLALKRNEWNAYCAHPTVWERERTLDI